MYLKRDGSRKLTAKELGGWRNFSHLFLILLPLYGFP